MGDGTLGRRLSLIARNHTEKLTFTLRTSRISTLVSSKAPTTRTHFGEITQGPAATGQGKRLTHSGVRMQKRVWSSRDWGGRQWGGEESQSTRFLFGDDLAPMQVDSAEVGITAETETIKEKTN